MTRPRWLALVVYPLVMLSSPGKMPADTKLFLYLDPGGVMHRASNTWDPSQFAGSVPHQQISYLWPAGPWFWVMDRVNVPDWIAHRLWIASLLFLAGWGVYWLARQLGFRAHCALAAGFVYMLSPYVLAYISRTSVMLLPWAGLGWLIGCTVLAARHGGWRYPACAALVVLTVGSTNATALALIAPAPIIWLLHAATGREVTWRNAALAATRIGALSILVSAWWIVFLVVQSRYGIDILSYTETLEAVSSTSIAPEAIRGLGYWLNYIRDHVQATTDAAGSYHTNFALLLTSYGLVMIGLVGLALVRWQGRRFAAMLLLIGTVLAVGVYPLTDPAPLFSGVADNTRSTLALALRSSTRALPMSMLALSLGAAALVGCIRHISRQRVAAGAVVLLAIANLPALWTGGLVDRYLTRDAEPPSAWREAVSALGDEAEDLGTTRVWQLPGAEFGAFRWGYTVDPPFPGLSSQPFISRDLQPLGSPAAMDLLYALDDRFQHGVVDPDSIAAVARLLGVETIWVAGDMAFERFRTPRPEATDALYRSDPDGLGQLASFGEPSVNEPTVAMLDEVAIANRLVGEPIAPVLLVDVEDMVAITRVKTAEVVLAGSGDGIIDAAAVGLINGQEVIFYSAALGHDLADRIARAGLVIVTDSNRDRAHQWRGSQDSTGFTEDGVEGADVNRFDSQDQRLPIFDDIEITTRTYVSMQHSPVSATASAYGYPLGYWPEYRAAMAIDGDISTAWLVGGLGAQPVGESITLQTPSPVAQVSLRQPNGDRRISEVDVVTSAGVQRVSLGDHDTEVTLDDPTSDVTIIIRAATPGSDPVGFSEIVSGLGTAEEVVIMPTDALSLVTNQPLALVMTRERVQATDRYRRDPEATIVRQFTLSEAEALTATVTVRLDARADDAALAAILGAPDSRASGSLSGVLAARPWAAIDGDPTTAWHSPFGDGVGQWIEVTPAPDVQTIELSRVSDNEHATITSVRVRRGGQDLVTQLSADDTSATVAVPAGIGPVRITVVATDGATTIDRRSGRAIGLPVGIAELSAPGLGRPLPATVGGECRDDLLRIDNRAISLRITGSTLGAIAGDALDVAVCDPSPIELSASAHTLRSTAGSGLVVDRVVLRNQQAMQLSASVPAVNVAIDATDDERNITVGACPDGCWLVFGEGFNDGWSAGSPELGSLGGPTMVDGGFNGWWLEPHDDVVHVRLRWAAQRPVNIALWCSGVAAAGCVALALWPLMRRRLPAYRSHGALLSNPEFIAPTLAWWPMDRVDGRRALLTAVATVAAAWLLVGPLGAAGAVVVTAATCGWWRRPQLNAAAGVAGAAVSTLYVLAQAVRLRPSPGSPFLSAVSDAHQPYVLAVVLIASGSLTAAAESRR
ncbi:MAG: alpha-(1-_3)-arabinofuranosyltransferase family protein [Ilumatobacteraceae bacterium]